MKNTALVLIVLVGFLFSCSDKTQEITFNEFDRLITADSIESIQINNDDRALITKRSSSTKGEKLELLIPSAEHMQDLLQNRYSKNKIAHVSFVKCTSPNRFFFNWFPIMFSICLLVLFLLAAIDILRNRFASDIEKLIWILVVIFVPILGPILYLLIGRKQKINVI